MDYRDKTNPPTNKQIKKLKKWFSFEVLVAILVPYIVFLMIVWSFSTKGNA